MLLTREINKSLNVCLDDNIEKLFLKNNYNNTTQHNTTTTTVKIIKTTTKYSLV